MTPQERLAAALRKVEPDLWDVEADEYASLLDAADPTIAADMELGRRIRDSNDPLLASSLAQIKYLDKFWATGLIDALRAALTEKASTD